MRYDITREDHPLNKNETVSKVKSLARSVSDGFRGITEARVRIGRCVHQLIMPHVQSFSLARKYCGGLQAKLELYTTSLIPALHVVLA